MGVGMAGLELSHLWIAVHALSVTELEGANPGQWVITEYGN